MKRTAGALLLVAAVGGCMSSGHRHGHGAVGNGCSSCNSHSAAIPGAQGAWGQPVSPTIPHYPMKSQGAAMPMPAQGMHADMMHAGGSGVVQASHWGHGAPSAPPPPYGAVAATGALTGGMGPTLPAQRTEVRFLGPDGTRVRWMGVGPDGRPMASTQSLSVPGRYNFLQGAIYRLKLDIPREDLTALYPTLEVVPANARTQAFLSHSAVPVAFTNEDFDQVRAGNYVIKVVYLPDPQFQDLATAGPEEIVSTRLEPGADPIAEAHRRGSVLLVVRFGNIDLELPHSPPLGVPGAGPMGQMTPEQGMPVSRRTAPSGAVQQVGHQTTQPPAARTAPAANKAGDAKSGSGLKWWNSTKK